MANKKNFVLRIDEDVYKLLQKWAADDFRSVNGQIEWLISEQLKELNRAKKRGPGVADKSEGKIKKS